MGGQFSARTISNFTVTILFRFWWEYKDCNVVVGAEHIDQLWVMALSGLDQAKLPDIESPASHHQQIPGCYNLTFL